MLQLIRDWSKRYLSDPQVIVLGLLLVAGFTFIFFLGDLLMPVLVALVIAYLLDGLVGFLQKRRFPRKLAVVFVFMIFIATMFVLILWLLPMITMVSPFSISRFTPSRTLLSPKLLCKSSIFIIFSQKV